MTPFSCSILVFRYASSSSLLSGDALIFLMISSFLSSRAARKSDSGCAGCLVLRIRPSAIGAQPSIGSPRRRRAGDAMSCVRHTYAS